MRIAVISDLHSNATALRAALAAAEARGFDALVVLGDLLTYGCDPNEVLDLIRDALSRHTVRLIPGNHDQLYFDLAAGNHAYFDRLPGWLRESVEWTWDNVRGKDLAHDFPWEKDVSLGGIFFAHANPFAYGDWTYLNTEGELDAAMAALRSRGETIGIFGHTHRGKVVEYPENTANGVRHELGTRPALSCDLMVGHGAVADPGSVGQPRGMGQSGSLLFVERSETRTHFRLQRLDYDVGVHLARIRASQLSGETQNKLMSYFA
jgi:predicted phosphodiesterase